MSILAITNRRRREKSLENLVQRIPNALNNPTSTCERLMETMREIKRNNAVLYTKELDEWFHLGLLKRRYDLLLVLYFMDDESSWLSPEELYNRLFRSLVKENPIKAAKMLDVGIALSTGSQRDIYRLWQSRDHMVLFKHVKAAPLILKIAQEQGYSRCKYLFALNVSLRRLRSAHWRLLRFWLHVKTMLPLWRETLYEPGTGALYLVACKRFQENQ